MTRFGLIPLLILSAGACSSDPADPAPESDVADAAADTEDAAEGDATDVPQEPDAEADVAVPDVVEDTTEDVPDVEPEVEVDVEPDAVPDAEPDTDPVTCTTARIDGEWRVEIADDVSIGYSVGIEASPEGFARDLIILFERYSPFPDVGFFDLSEGADSNFGTCAHCVYVRGDSNVQALFVEQGTLDIRQDPYTRALNLTAGGLTLIQVDVDLETRYSTPVPGGACLVLGDFDVEQTFAEEGWTCDPDLYNNGESCECECGAFDPDCAVGGECPPFDPGCEEVPELPISDCTVDEVCGFDPEAEAPACQETCEWLPRSPCNIGVCTPSIGVADSDVCLESTELLNSAQIGEFCDAGSRYQQFCNVVDGYALGYCDYRYECRPICSSNEDCTDEGDECQYFLAPGESLGFCGTIPEDG